MENLLSITSLEGHLCHKELEEGFGEVYIPEALARKYPNDGREIGWQWVFPARERSVDPRSGREMAITRSNPGCRRR